MVEAKSSSDTYTPGNAAPPQLTRQGIKLQEIDISERFHESGFGKLYVGTDKNLYFLDSDGVFTPIALSGAAASKNTILSITGAITAGSNFDVTASGANYTHSKDAGNLRASEAAFKEEEAVKILHNGLFLNKETEVVWVSQTVFQLVSVAFAGDELIIFS